MMTFTLPQCPHCAEANAQGTTQAPFFHVTEPFNFSISGHCLACQKPLLGVGKIAYEYKADLTQAQATITQYEGPLEQLALIQLIRWLPVFTT